MSSSVLTCTIANMKCSITGHTQVLKEGWFCHQSCHVMRGEGLTPWRAAVWAERHWISFVLLFLLSGSAWGKFVVDGSIHVLSLAFCFYVYGFAFFKFTSVLVYFLCFVCMSTWHYYFCTKQLLKSCHAVSQTQGRTENSDKQDIAFLLNCARILACFDDSHLLWLVKIVRVWLKSLTIWCLDFWCVNSNWNAQPWENYFWWHFSILSSCRPRNLMLMKTYPVTKEVIYSGPLINHSWNWVTESDLSQNINMTAINF